jgi:hypothetical protein
VLVLVVVLELLVASDDEDEVGRHQLEAIS